MKKKATGKQLLENLNNHDFYQNYIIPEDLMIKHKDKINWRYISRLQTLSEKFITKHKDKVNWNRISSHQDLSEKFIEKHKDKVNWNWVSINQKLSEKFINKYEDKVNLFLALINKKIQLSYSFIEKHFQLKNQKTEKPDISVPLKEKTFEFLEV